MLDSMSEKGWNSVENWKSRVSYNYGTHGENRLKVFIKYLEENEPKLSGLIPDQLIDYQRQAQNHERYEILDALQRWVNSQPLLRAQSKSGYYTSIRSFFMHNRAELPKDPSYIIRSEVPPVRSKLEVDIVKHIILSSKPRYQAIFSIMTMAGLDEASFIHWNQTSLESTLKQLREKPEGPIRVELPGRKSSKNIENFYTFFGSDAADRLSKYLKHRGNKPGPIFKVTKKAMIKYWTRQLKRLGYIEQETSSKGNRYGLNLHRLRGIFRSRWRLSGVDIEIAEFFLGHAPDKLGYDKSPWLDPDFYEDKYVEAQPWLNILSEDPQNVPRIEVTELRKQIRDLEAGQDNRVAGLEAKVEELSNLLLAALNNPEALAETRKRLKNQSF